MSFQESGLPFPIRTTYMLMVDHFDQTASGKPLLVGVFETFLTKPQNDGRLIVRAGMLVARVESSLAAGSQHEMVLTCENEDNARVFSSPPVPLILRPSGEGLPLSGMIAFGIGPIVFPAFGRYEWALRTAGRVIGRCPFGVYPQPAA